MLSTYFLYKVEVKISEVPAWIPCILYLVVEETQLYGKPLQPELLPNSWSCCIPGHNLLPRVFMHAYCCYCAFFFLKLRVNCILNGLHLCLFMIECCVRCVKDNWTLHIPLRNLGGLFGFRKVGLLVSGLTCGVQETTGQTDIFLFL